MISPVGILDIAADLFRFSKSAKFDLSTANMGIASSFDSTLQTVTGPSMGLVLAGEAQAYTVPGVSRVTQLYGTAAAKAILKDSAGNEPAWMKGYGAITPGGLTSGMVLSLFFHGKAVLWSTRNDQGEITDICLLPSAQFGLDLFGRVTLKGVALPNQADFIFIRSILGQGFLDFGKDSITHYLGLRDSILSRSRNPIPVVELKVTDNFSLDETELKAAQTAWQVARSADNGAVAITPFGLDAIIHGDKADTAMLGEARNEVRKDIANFANINVSMLDGNNGASDTYSNTLQDKDEFIDLSLDTFLVPIEQRFSMPDVSDGLTFDRSVFKSAPPAKGNTGDAGGLVKGEVIPNEEGSE